MRVGAFAAGVIAVALTGCGSLPGRPRQGPPVPPDQVMDFPTLYQANCQACHGANGQNGPATELANPEYLALVDDNALRTVVVNGMPGTQMPAWGQSAGGMLTDPQINALIAGMRREWGKQNAFGGATPPPYRQPQGGNVQHGQQVYQQRCAGCHQGNVRAQLTSPVYLSLVSDQALRSIVIAGRPDIGQPDWRLAMQGASAGQPLSPQDVTDVVTYLGSLRNTDSVSAAPNPIPPRR